LTAIDNRFSQNTARINKLPLVPLAVIIPAKYGRRFPFADPLGRLGTCLSSFSYPLYIASLF
jgi:hypothetical protein